MEITSVTPALEVDSDGESVHSIEAPPTDSVNTEGSTGTLKRKRGGNKRPPSEVWQFVDKGQIINAKGEVEVTATCRTCKHVMLGHSSRGTTAIRYHLKKCKGSGLYNGGSDDTQPTLSVENMGSVVPHQFNQKRSEEKCLAWIIRAELPFRTVEHASFIEFMKELQPRFKVPNRKKIALGVWNLYHVEKAKIMSVIGDLRVSITTDTWTSVQNINYMVVTCHFLDSDWTLHKRIINFTKITSHKGDDIGRVLDASLNDWGIKNVFTIAVDNASANEKAIEYMKRRLESRGTLLLKGVHLHMRCACHIINLIVKDGIKELNSAIDGIRNCVKFIHSSPARLDLFRGYTTLECNDKMATIPLDVVTRWNSTYLMLNRSFKYSVVFSQMAEECEPFKAYFKEEKKEGPPTMEDWAKAESLALFLKRFYNATLSLSAIKTPTSNLVLDIVFELQLDIIEKSKDEREENRTLKNVACSMLTKLTKYWGALEEVNPILLVAQVLDPRYKLELCEYYMKAFKMDIFKIEAIKSLAKSSLDDLFMVYKNESGETNVIVENNDSSSSLVVSEVEEGSSSWVKKNMFLQRKVSQTKEICNEVDKYLHDPFESDNNGAFKVLDWWKANRFTFPILSKIAKDVLALPSSTVASENAFSLGKRVVDPFRASLTPKMVEALVCTSDWLKADTLEFYKEPIEDEIAFYKECEEIEKSVASFQGLSLVQVQAPSSSSSTHQLPPRPTIQVSKNSANRGRGRARG